MDLISTSPQETVFPPNTPPTIEAAATPAAMSSPDAVFDWECGAAEAEMQRLLALLPAPEEAREELVGLGLDFSGLAGAADFGGATESGWGWREAVGAF
jgi:transcriptional activator HAC1